MFFRPRVFICLLAAALGCATYVAAAGPTPTGGAEITPFPHAVSWTDLSSLPCRHRGETVRFTVQFHGLLNRWTPGPTRFGPGAFAGISAWADEQFPWVENEFENPAVRAFARRGSELQHTLASATPHQRFAVEGVVREVWLDRPWIELVALTPLTEAIGEATVFHAARAIELMEDGTFVLADEALQQALQQDGLPSAAREELGRLREICAAEIASPKPPPIRPRNR